MRLLSLAAVARQLGVCSKTAKKLVARIPGAVVDVNGRPMFRHDLLVQFIEHGGQVVEKPAA